MEMLDVESGAREGTGVLRRYSCMCLGTASVESAEPGRTRSKWGDERVELAFATAELRRICESRRRAINVLGANAARELAQRLADILALSTAAEFADLFSGDIVDRSPSERALRLEGGHELVFCAGHVEVPVMEDGSTNLAEVSRLRIIALEARCG